MLLAHTVMILTHIFVILSIVNRLIQVLVLNIFASDDGLC